VIRRQQRNELRRLTQCWRDLPEGQRKRLRCGAAIGRLIPVPLQINFDLTFQNVANQWRPFGISVATPQAPPETAAAPAPAAAKKNAAQKN
jgi:hypothetical protein